MSYKFNPNKPYLIVSSCYARQCHPETCCCDYNEYALQQEVVTENYLGMSCGYHYTTLMYGAKEDIERYVKICKVRNVLGNVS